MTLKPDSISKPLSEILTPMAGVIGEELAIIARSRFSEKRAQSNFIHEFNDIIHRFPWKTKGAGFWRRLIASESSDIRKTMLTNLSRLSSSFSSDQDMVKLLDGQALLVREITPEIRNSVANRLIETKGLGTRFLFHMFLFFVFAFFSFLFLLAGVGGAQGEGVIIALALSAVASLVYKFIVEEKFPKRIELSADGKALSRKTIMPSLVDFIKSENI